MAAYVLTPEQDRALSVALSGPARPYTTIAKEVGVTRNVVVYRAHKMGLDARSPGRPRKTPNDRVLSVEAAEAVYAEVGNFRLTGEAFGVSGERIAQLIGRRKDRKAAA